MFLTFPRSGHEPGYHPTKVAGRVRGPHASNNSDDSDEQLAMEMGGHLSIAQSLPPMTEIVRHGQSWQMLVSGGYSSAAYSTTPDITVVHWNNERIVVIDSVCAFVESGGAASSDELTVTWMTTQSSTATLLDKSFWAPGDALAGLSGQINYNGSLLRYNPTADPVNIDPTKWMNFSTSSPNPPHGTTNLTREYKFDGGLLLDSGSWFHLMSTSATADMFMRFCVRWHEIAIPVM